MVKYHIRLGHDVVTVLGTGTQLMFWPKKILCFLCVVWLNKSVLEIVLAELDDYLDLARAGPSLSDEQHIYHKLVFDAVNEAINECIMDVRRPTSI